MKIWKNIVLGFLISYWVVLGVSIIGWSLDIIHNSHLVMLEGNKVKITSIDEDENLTLEDGTTVDKDKISEYIRVEKGSGTWYINGSQMTAEVTIKDIVSTLRPFIAVGLILLIWLCIRAVVGRKFLLYSIASVLYGVWFGFVCWIVYGYVFKGGLSVVIVSIVMIAVLLGLCIFGL